MKTHKFSLDAVIYEEGTVRLLERLVYLPEPRRAIVTILDEAPIFQKETEISIDETMLEPIVLNNRTIDLHEASEIYDKGDYILINFHLYHQPPHIFLTGKDAEIMRTWLKNNDDSEEVEETEEQPLREEEINALEQLVLKGKSLDAEQTLRLITGLRAIREDRDSIIRHTAGTIHMLFDHCEGLQQAFAANKVKTVKCHYSEGCNVQADNSCIHTRKRG